MDTEQDFLLDLKKGSPAAFESLYQRYFKMIAALIQRMGGNQEDVEDVFQEVLFVLVKNLREPDFRLTSKISTYMHAIARNLMLKKGHKGHREITLAGEDFLKFSLFDDNGGENFEQKELMIGIVFDKINELGEDCRQVVRLTFLKKLSHEEVATLLGYTVAFVKVKKFRCLKHLRELVGTSPFLHD